jgi:peptide chain release factor 2
LCLQGEFDSRPAILSIHAGQGGTEAMDWADMLLRMYLRYCEHQKWQYQIVNQSSGDEAGIKQATVHVKGQYAYGYLKHEAGTHRLVRLSPFNADNLRQTSFALVEVLPELESTGSLELNDQDLEWSFFRSSGKGGQNVNKVSTAVRLKHLPSGIVVESQTERSQERNRELARSLLFAKLWEQDQRQKDTQLKTLKGSHQPASFGTGIRSYVLHPYQLVKDNRTGTETSDAAGVLDGLLDPFIKSQLQLNLN